MEFPVRDPGKNAPNPLDDLPSSHSAERIPIRGDCGNNDAIRLKLPDLTVRNCSATLPEPAILKLPEKIPSELTEQIQFSYRQGILNFEIFNKGPGNSPGFDVQITFAISKFNTDEDRYDPPDNPTVRTISVTRGLRAGGNMSFSQFLPSLPFESGNIHTVVVEVNPMTKEHPLGKVVELDYSNNRCGCTFFDHPGWKRPSETAHPSPEIPDLGPHEPLIRESGEWFLDPPTDIDPPAKGGGFEGEEIT